MIRQLILIFVLSCVLPLSAQRQMKTINDGWHFMKQENSGNVKPKANDTRWEHVSIPHSWNTDAYTVKDYYRGEAWYRKTLFVPQTDKDRQLFIRFEAVNHSASVYINGKHLGDHKGGYTAFTFDITSHCQFGADNIIEVKADNSLNDVPPYSADFTIFGGIYRDVWLISTPKQHVDLLNMGSDGIFVETKNVSENSADYLVRGSITNDASAKTKVKVTSTIKNELGETVKTTNQVLQIAANSKQHFEQAGSVTNPSLWSPETPDLYTVEIVVSDFKTNKLLDKVDSYTGFRWYAFDGGNGFQLNGKPYKLNGICRHQDQKPFANALSDDMHRRDMQLIKDMGVNFIRISHYPQDAAILEQCDKLGILVWEEIPVIDIVPDAPLFAENCESSLREMIRQHYNHPSIIMWGYMNEILLATQRQHKGDELKIVENRSLDLAKHLESVLKEEDSNRLSVMAFHGSESYNHLGFNDIVDVVGWNLYQGWYSEDMTHLDQFIQKQKELYPNKPMILSEYGAGSDKRIHSEKAKRFDFSIQFHQEYAEYYLALIEREPYISGSTYWNFIDFGSAKRDESMPRINNKGLVYSNRTPKDVYYLFKAYFRKDAPVLHIASADWKNRMGFKNNDEMAIQPVKVYSNLDEIELFMNGESLGKKQCVDRKAVWNVPFTEGDHYFSAKSTYDGKIVETGLSISFSFVPEVLDNTFSNKELAINVGSNCFYTSDDSSLTWVPDKEYTQGGWGYIGGKSTSTQTQIEGTTDNPLYQTMRETPEMYRLDVAEGKYEIELLFADIFKSQEALLYALGSENENHNSENVFDIVINSVTVDSNIDLGNTVGYYAASKRRYVIDVAEGENIKVVIQSQLGKTFLNGLKIRKL